MVEPVGSGDLSRRNLIRAAAWSVPTVTVATASPAFAASGTAAVDSVAWTGTTPTSPNTGYSGNLPGPLQILAKSGTDTVSGATVTFKITSSAGSSVTDWTITSVPGSATGSWDAPSATFTTTTDTNGVASAQVNYSSTRPSIGSTITITATSNGISPTTTPGGGTGPWTTIYLPYIAVDRIGGTTSSASAVFLDEFDSTIIGATTPVTTFPLPTATAAPNLQLTDGGSATSEGGITVSTDRRYALVPGYAAPVGTASVVSTTAAAAPRVVGLVSSTGTIDTQTTMGGKLGGSSNNFRSAVSDGTTVWGAGAAGLAWSTKDTTTGNPVSASNFRYMQIAGGELYYSTSSAPTGIYKFSGSLPTSSATATILTGSPGSGSPYGFVLLASAGGAGLDTLYVADDASTGTIKKYWLSAGSWTAAGTLTAAGGRGLAGYVDPVSGNAILFATSPNGATLYKITDTAAHNTTISATSVMLATAPAGNVFRGVAFAPDVA